MMVGPGVENSVGTSKPHFEEKPNWKHPIGERGMRSLGALHLNGCAKYR